MRQLKQTCLKKTYKSTPEDVKRKLMYKVLVESRSIKQAAKLLRLNYSTAKTIVRQRKSLQADTASTTHSHSRHGKSLRARTRQLLPREKPRIHIVCSIGNEEIDGLRAGIRQISPTDIKSLPMVVMGKFKIQLS